MSNLSGEKRERLEKINEMFFYNVGYNHIDGISDETDKLLEEYKDIKIPESLDT